MHSPLVLAVVLALTSPVLAAATPWQDVALGARIRLISGDVIKPDGTTLVGLQIDMPDNFKTYWRSPGESGIPTELNIDGSSGVSGAEIQWPYPTTEISNGFLDYVYRGPTLLPVSLRVAGGSATLVASVLMGVCSEVCVPVRAKFTLPLAFAAPDAAQNIRLAQALALVPLPWPGAEAPFGTIGFDAAVNGLRVPFVDPEIDPASIIASTGDPTQVFGAPQKSPDTRAVILPLRGTTKAGGWKDQPVQLTFMTAKGSFKFTEPVSLAAP